MKFHILGSSSSGNCSLLTTSNSKILIDAGFSGKKIEAALKAIGEDIANVSAVFLTHEHSDHAIGIPGLSKHAHLKFFANYHTASSIKTKLKRPVEWGIFETGTSFKFLDFNVNSFSIPHDAYDPVGLIFETQHNGTSSRLAWLTDLGHMPQGVKEKVKDVDFLVLEANYDLDLLEADTKRPLSIKQRIRGRHGHLSNEAALEYLAEAQNPRWQHVCLAHLSKDCNSIAAIEKTFKPLISSGKQNYEFTIIDPLKLNAYSFDWLATNSQSIQPELILN